MPADRPRIFKLLRMQVRQEIISHTSVRRSVLSGPTRDLPVRACLADARLLCYFTERERQSRLSLNWFAHLQ